MEYREIVAVTGIGGLFQLLATKSDGAIVRNLADQSTKFISARQHNVTPLESIEVYTTGENVRLHEVFQAMKDAEATTPLPDTKKGDMTAIRAYFGTVLPDYDEERVYASDLKKMVKWYELLKTNELLDFSRYLQQEEEDAELPLEGEAQVAEAIKEEAAIDQSSEAAADEKPAKKAAKKKATDEAAEDEEKPAKKTAKKKKDEEASGDLFA